jgi:hypothetical protein
MSAPPTLVNAVNKLTSQEAVDTEYALRVVINYAVDGSFGNFNFNR